MDNLLELVGKQLTPEVVNALGSVSGTTPTQTQSALGAIVPGLMGVLAQQGSTPSGAQMIMDLLGKQTDGEGLPGGNDLLGNLTGMLGGSDSSQSLLSTGAGIVTALMGGNTNKLIESIASAVGIPRETTATLLHVVAPLVMGVLGKKVAGDNLNASGLANLLGGQMDFVKAAAPQGLVDAMGLSLPSVSAPPMQPAAVPPPVTVPPPPAAPAQTTNWLWWVVGVVVLLVILWWLFMRPAPTTGLLMPAELLTAVGVVAAGLV